MTLTKRIEAIEERLKKATPGPWKEEIEIYWSDEKSAGGQVDILCPPYDYSNESSVAALSYDSSLFSNYEADAELIAHAPTDLALLLALVKEYRAALEIMEQVAPKYHADGCRCIQEDASDKYCNCGCKTAREALRCGEGMG